MAELPVRRIGVEAKPTQASPSNPPSTIMNVSAEPPSKLLQALQLQLRQKPAEQQFTVQSGGHLLLQEEGWERYAPGKAWLADGEVPGIFQPK